MPQRQYYQNVLQHLASTQEQEVFPTNHHTHTRISTAMATVGLACLGKKQNEKERKLTLLIMEKKVPMTYNNFDLNQPTSHFLLLPPINI